MAAIAIMVKFYRMDPRQAMHYICLFVQDEMKFGKGNG